MIKQSFVTENRYYFNFGKVFCVVLRFYYKTCSLISEAHFILILIFLNK